MTLDPAKSVFVTGGVESVDLVARTVTLWLCGFRGYHTVPITDEMPGWMLEPGTTFQAYISEENYRRGVLDSATWAGIEPQECADLSEDELLESLDETFRGMGLAAS